jgi:hypothetical protein
MRAWFGVPADKLLPSLIADAEDEVAAFKGILKILTGNDVGRTKSSEGGVTKVPQEGGTEARDDMADVGLRTLHPDECILRLWLARRLTRTAGGTPDYCNCDGGATLIQQLL